MDRMNFVIAVAALALTGVWIGRTNRRLRDLKDEITAMKGRGNK